MIVVDVFARVRGHAAQQPSAYEADYAPMAALKAIADKYSVAILVVHHTRKAGAEDFMDQVSGTQGLNGAADATMVLKRSRGSADAVLQVTGREIDEAEYAMTFAADIGCWQMLDGPAGDYSLGDTRQVILRHLRDQGPMTPKRIAEALEINYETTKKTCQRMVAAGQLDTNGQGYYFPPLSPVPPFPAVPHSHAVPPVPGGLRGHKGQGQPGDRRPGMNREQRRAARRAGIPEVAITYADDYRCPDCNAETEFRIEAGLPLLNVLHDPTCPTWQSHQARAGRPASPAPPDPPSSADEGPSH